MTIRSHTFAGRRFAVRPQTGLRRPLLAECDYGTRTIRIPTDGDTLDELDQIVHESLHAAYPWMEEDHVNAGATSIARMLWRLGWRRE